MRRIEIDDAVYAALAGQASGFDTPNDVLRRLLLPAAAAGHVQARPTEPGALYALLERGVMQPADELRHVQVRRGRSLRGTVEPDGWVRTELGRYRQPSPALRDLVGTQIDGWANWTHQPSGRSLRQLRDEPAAATGGRT